MSAGRSPPRRAGSKPKGSVRAKSGCYTCRIRRKKCDEQPDAEGACQTCVRLRLQCLGFGAKRPDWMREGNSVKEIRERIKVFLAQNGMIKGHSAPSASLRSPDLTLVSPDSSTSTNPRLDFPPTQSAKAIGSTGLNTPLSPSSALSPEEHSASPPSPSSSDSHSTSYAHNRSFPPGLDDSSMGPQHDDALADLDSTTRQDQTASSGFPVLELSNGRPLPSSSHSYEAPSRSSRSSRRPPYSSGRGGSSSEFGLGLSMGVASTNNFNSRRSPPAISRRHRTADLLGCGLPPPNHTTFPLSDNMTTFSTASTTMPAHPRFSPIPYSSISSRLSSGPSTSVSSSTASGLTYPYLHAHPSSTTPNSISNITNVASPMSGYASSTSSSPPMRSHHTSFTPYTPLSSLPSLPAVAMERSMDMDWTPAGSASASMVMSSSGSDADLRSPVLDVGVFGTDMDMRLTSGHSSSRPGLRYGYGSNDGFDTNGSDVRVKIDPDTVGLDIDPNYAHNSNAYAFYPYDSANMLRPRSVTHDDGCATPIANTSSNFNSGSATHQFVVNAPVNNNNNNTNNYMHPYLSNSQPTNPNAFRGMGGSLSTSMGMRESGMYPHHPSTVNSPYYSAPQLSPDSPKPSHRADPMLGPYEPAPAAHMNGSGHGPGNAYISVAHHAPGQFAVQAPHARHGGAGHGGFGGGGHGYDHNLGHGQPAAISSWAGEDPMRLTNQQQQQEQLLHEQQQIQAQGPYPLFHTNHSNDSGTLQFPTASPTVRRTDLRPPSQQSSFSPHYYPNFATEEFGMNDMEAFPAQQAPPLNALAVSGVDESALMSLYQFSAPINGATFYGLTQEEQFNASQGYAALQLLQPALMDPLYADRGDGSLVEHYLRHVRPVQYFFWDEHVASLLRGLAVTNDAVRNAICSVASVHKRRMREGSIRLQSSSPSHQARLSLSAGSADAPEGDDGTTYHDRTQSALRRTGPEGLTKAEAMAGLQCISSFLFAGGLGGWDFFLDVACQWVEKEFTQLQREVGDLYLLDALSRKKNDDELGSNIVRTTMWFEVLASVTMVREPRFLGVYRKLFGSAGNARITEVGVEAMHLDSEFSMLEVMGCDNLTFLALAEISALAAWKEEETKKQTLSSIELVKRGMHIEDRCLRHIAEVGANNYRGGSTVKNDSLENRRRLTADIFRASARLYLHTVLSGDKPSVQEIRQGVSETIEALQRVPAEPKSLRRSVVRSVVFPICLAGCLTDDKLERTTVKQVLESEDGAGNCGSVVAVMEAVWERRDAKPKRGRLGRRAEIVPDVSWREVLREHGGGAPILLV